MALESQVQSLDPTETVPGRAPLDGHVAALRERWAEYRERGTFPHFVEFSLALNSLTEQFTRLKLPGLIRLCVALENTALTLFGDQSTHPIEARDASQITRELDTLVAAVESMRPAVSRETRRAESETADAVVVEWTKPRSVALVADEAHPWVRGLLEQFAFFGFRIARHDWAAKEIGSDSPLVILFIPPAGGYGAGEQEAVKAIRAKHPSSQLFCLSVPKSLATMVGLMRAGADVVIQPDEEVSTVLARVLEITQAREQDPCRVLVVEDSATAIALIQRALSQHQIDSHAIRNPQQILAAVEMYRPDLVLMDMHMPHFNGVEATRVMRQLAHYQSMPVVYLSSEKDMGLQVEALRLGGDQFLTKPFNPVVLAAVVKTKIERYREMQRWSQHDSLTGLLNHSAAKTRLNQLVQAMDAAKDKLCVAMIDIDHFKSINDHYGHPVGDQVIRSLAWLLKGRLRGTDAIGRYGGEEFIVVMRNAAVSEASAVLNRIRVDFSTLPHAHASGTLRATFSAGIASFPTCLSANDLSRVADEALLLAKGRGRNRIDYLGT